MVIVEIAGTDKEKYKILVSDNGPGIPEGHLQVDLQPFLQGE